MANTASRGAAQVARSMQMQRDACGHGQRNCMCGFVPTDCHERRLERCNNVPTEVHKHLRTVKGLAPCGMPCNHDCCRLVIMDSRLEDLFGERNVADRLDDQSVKGKECGDMVLVREEPKGWAPVKHCLQRLCHCSQQNWWKDAAWHPTRTEGGRGIASANVEVALVAGRSGGLFQGEQPLSINGINGFNMMSRRYAIALHFLPLVVWFLCSRCRKYYNEDVNQVWDNLGWIKPPAWATLFMSRPPHWWWWVGSLFFKHGAFVLVTSQYPIIPMLLLEVEMGG